MLRKALFFRKNDDRVKCCLCPHNCNIPNGVDISNTYCPQCGHLLIERKGYYTTSYLEEENCPNCKAEINIVI